MKNSEVLGAASAKIFECKEILRGSLLHQSEHYFIVNMLQFILDYLIDKMKESANKEFMKDLENEKNKEQE